MTSIIKARKKPITIEAMQWTGNYDDATFEFTRGNTDEIIAWVGVQDPDKLRPNECTVVRVLCDGANNWWLEIPTLEGSHSANPFDYIIKGVAGEFYPCKREIFEQTYEIIYGSDEPSFIDGRNV